jgi:hypothetical protein
MNIQANSDPRQAPQEEKKLGRGEGERAADLLCSRGVERAGCRDG